jgi:hypothetical protein
VWCVDWIFSLTITGRNILICILAYCTVNGSCTMHRSSPRHLSFRPSRSSPSPRPSTPLRPSCVRVVSNTTGTHGPADQLQANLVLHYLYAPVLSLFRAKLKPSCATSTIAVFPDPSPRWRAYRCGRPHIRRCRPRIPPCAHLTGNVAHVPLHTLRLDAASGGLSREWGATPKGIYRVQSGTVA